MPTAAEIEARLERILLQAQKPGRYVGGEFNSIVKNWDATAVHIALVFPDIYDIGVSNVGLKILYDQINQRDDALAERACAPWVDMEALMREHGIPLYSLESKRPLACFDLIGITLPYETLYTNALNILDLAGIPLRAEQRDETHPIVIAGGHACFNPEPMHAFMDAFVIGEGEEVIHEIIDVFVSWRAAVGRVAPKGRIETRRRSPGLTAARTGNPHADEEIASTHGLDTCTPWHLHARASVRQVQVYGGNHAYPSAGLRQGLDELDPAAQGIARPASRNDILKELAKIPGVYVPRFYRTHYLDDGTVSHVETLVEGIAHPVVKRIVAKLPPPPTRFIVPNIDIVHNRVSVEIMRGCTRGCRFCHAGMITRPVRERSVEEIVRAAEEAIAATGFEELALLSLSSSDYMHIVELVGAVSERFRGRKMTISLPSLRIETVSVDLMEELKDHRSGGFTLAPEAATERMRRIINKYIPDEQIIATVREIYRRGWTTIKLYFMIGHPSETLEDVQAIADLCKRVLAEGRKALGMKAKVHAGVSTFVPKPQTPFQWVACDRRENIQAKQALLKRELRDRNIRLSWTEPEETLLEAWLSRGDRRLAEVVYTAWQNGARFDAWSDQRRFDLWMAAFAQHGLDPAFYTHRPRRADEVFPWEHISAAVRKNFLFQDFRMSLEGELRIDCRLRCFACGILPTFAGLRRENPGEIWNCPEVKSPRKPVISDQLPVSNGEPGPGGGARDPEVEGLPAAGD